MIWSKYKDVYEPRRRTANVDDQGYDEYFMDDDDNTWIIRLVDDIPWKKNKSRVKGQLGRYREMLRRRKAKHIIIPSDLSKRCVKWWKTFINNGYMRSYRLKHRNGKAITMEYMAKMQGVSVSTIKRVIQELTENGYMIKDDGFFRMMRIQYKKMQRQKGGRPRKLTESQSRIFNRLE